MDQEERAAGARRRVEVGGERASLDGGRTLERDLDRLARYGIREGRAPSIGRRQRQGKRERQRRAKAQGRSKQDDENGGDDGESGAAPQSRVLSHPEPCSLLTFRPKRHALSTWPPKKQKSTLTRP